MEAWQESLIRTETILTEAKDEIKEMRHDFNKHSAIQTEALVGLQVKAAVIEQKVNGESDKRYKLMFVLAGALIVVALGEAGLQLLGLVG